MKVLCCGDLHFAQGYSFGKIDTITGVNSRLLDYEKTLAKIIDYAIENVIDLFIFLGDIFETRSPPPTAVVAFYRQLKRLVKANIPTYVIMGNHDALLGRNITSSLDPLKELAINNVFVFTNMQLTTFTANNGEKLNILLMPYKNRQSYDKPTNEEAIKELKKELAIIQSQKAPNAKTLACIHMMFENTIPADAGEYGLNELILPFEMFDGIDVSIAGHIHKSSILQQEPLIIYSGSMECNDFSEREHKKVFIVYDTSKKGIGTIEFKPITTRKFVDFDIDYSSKFPEEPMNDILQQINNKNVKEAIVRISIKVPENKVANIDTTIIRNTFNNLNVSCISNISVIPVVSRQLRNQKVNEAPDDITAFKHYISSQIDVDDSVLELGLSIMNPEI
jgi:exonuclease SbcD